MNKQRLVPEDITTSQRLAGLVKRWHTWPISRQQNIAEHSWQVARVYRTLFGSGDMPACVWDYIWMHDVAEIAVGDVPYPVKSTNDTIKRVFEVLEIQALSKMGLQLPVITSEQKNRIKLCELIEMWEYGIEEFQRGNQFAIPVLDRCEEGAIQMTLEWKNGEPDYDLNQKISDYIFRFKQQHGYV